MLGVMRTHSRRTLIVAGSVAVIGIAVATSFIWSSDGGSLTAKALRIDRQELGGAGDGVSVPSTKVVADFFRLKYSQAQRSEFHVTSSQSIAIFVRATGVQIRTASGWQPFSEEQRNEIWRLKPGIARELFVERPEKEAEETWRVYVHYGVEMHGPPLWKAQLREAWRIRSITNWTGKAWGGGRFSGRNEFLSDEFAE